MQLVGLARLGQDVTLRFTPEGTPVANLSLAFNYGKKDGQGKRPVQWIDAALWGERAQALEQWLVKGQQFMVHLADPHLETFQRTGGGEGVKIVCHVNVIEFAGPPPEQSAGQQPPARQQQPQRPQQQQSERERNRTRQYAQNNDFDDTPF